MALIDEIRRKNPSLQNRSDDEIKSVLRQSDEFKYFSDQQFDAYVSGAPAAPEDGGGTPGFLGGVAAGIDQVQAMGGGLVMAAGEAMESEGVLNTGHDIYQRNMDEAAENDLGYGFTDIRSAGDAWNWARYMAGNQLPMIAASIAGGGLGGAVAGGGAKMLAGAAAKQGAKRAGQALGAYTAAAGMETGALMGETEDLDVSLAHGTLAGAMEAITPVRLLRRTGAHELADKAADEISDRVLTDLQRQAGRSTAGAVRSGSLTGLMTEATTEGLQGLIGQHANYWVENNGESLLANLGDVDVKALVDEAAAGGLIGGVLGVPSGIGERNQARSQAARIEAARAQVAQQGGDALDQAMAGQQAEQSGKAQAEPADPQVAAQVGNRIQLAMGELDDLQNLAKGASYQGQTRLTNIKRMIDRAEQAMEQGNVAQAERLTARAERIAANLRGALSREGTNERPARREGEIVDGDEGRAQDGVAGLIGQDGRRLPPGDPDTIFAGGPTADQTQYEPQARNVRRDEALAAQRQGAQRMREQQAGQRPQISDQGIIYGDGPTVRRGNANTGLDQPVSDPRFTDTGARQEAEASRARQQAEAARVAELARTRGQSETAYLSDNTPVATRFRVADLAELRPSNSPDGRVNPDYPQELQPRDRTNANSQVQVRNIAARLNPERLGSSTDAGSGAPIIGPDGVVESGNGRTMAIATAYQQGGNRAQAYRDFVRRQAAEQGMDPTAVDAMQEPVLVRERVSDIDRADFARRANDSQVAGMTAYEQAQADAAALSGDDLQAWAPDQSGDPLAASNRGFQRRFVQRLGNNEAARYTTRGGQASPELGQRMQRAVFAKAFADSDMVAMGTEQGDQMRNLTAALQVAAPDLALARETGSQEALDAIGTITDAVRLLRNARQSGVSVRELARQDDAFTAPVPNTTALLAVTLNTNLRSRPALTEAMRYIGQTVRQRAESERNGALFEDTTTNEDVFNAALQDQGQRAPERSPETAVQRGAESGQPGPAEGREAGAAQGAQAGQQAEALRGEPLDGEWSAFSEASGTRGIPRAEMPQIKAEHRGALANFLSARGIDSAEDTVPALSLRPTQREFSEQRVQAAREREGGDRAILVSANGHVVDGHHQWLARADQGDRVRVIRLDAPIEEVLEAAHDFPSSEVDNDVPLLATYDEQELADREQAQQQADQDEAERRRQEEVRAQADLDARDFALTGSDRAADVAAAVGQQDPMSAQPTQEPSAAATRDDAAPSLPSDASLQYRANGSPFATARSAEASKYAKEARREGRRVETVEVEGGVALSIESEAAMVARERETILDIMRDTGRRYPDREYGVALELDGAARKVIDALGRGFRPADIRDRAGLSTADMRAAFEEGQQGVPAENAARQSAPQTSPRDTLRQAAYETLVANPHAEFSEIRQAMANAVGEQGSPSAARRAGMSLSDMEELIHDVRHAIQMERARNLPVPVTPEMIGYELGEQAARGTHMMAEKAGRHKVDGHVIHLLGVWDKLARLARTDGQQAVLAEEFKRYRSGYLQRAKAQLGRESQTMSTFIAGAGNFNVQRNNKKLRSAQKAMDDLEAFDEKAQKAMRKKLRTTNEDGSQKTELEQARERMEAAEQAQEQMKAANRIIRSGKDVDRRLVEEAGLSEQQAADIQQPNGLGDIGFPAYTLRNNNARLKQARQRVAQLEALALNEQEAATGNLATEHAFDGGRLDMAIEDQRLRLHFDEKPADEVRTQLKARGFRWSRKHGAWQRKLTRSAIQVGADIVGLDGQAIARDLDSDPRFSLGGTDTRPPQAGDVTAMLEGQPELAEARVIQTARELPPQALLGMALRGIDPSDVRGMYIGGELYVIADNLESAQEGLEVAVHEAVGHKGMRALLGEDLDRVMLDLYRGLPNSKEGRAALAEVRRDYPFLDPAKREDRITIGEEMVAHLLEKGARPKALQRAVAKVRELLRRVFPSIAWTYTDVLALGEKSRDYLRRQQAEQKGEDVQLYSLRGKERVAFESQFDDFTDADRAAAAKIGARTPPQRAMDWFKEKADRAGLKIRQGMVDRVAALKEIDERLYGESAMGENIQRSSWVLARMSGAANGALHALLHNGRIRLDAKKKVITLQDGDAKGLGEALGRLGSAAEIERFMGWIAGNRAARLAQDGRENLFDVGDIEAMKGWNRGQMEDGRRRETVYREVFDEFQTYRDDVLAVAEQSGIISNEQREMWAEEFYVPFYRLAEDNNGQVSGMMATSGLSRQQAYKRLKGGTQNLNDLLQNTMMNFHHLLDASLKNQAAVQAVKNAKQLGMVEKVPESNRDTKKSTFVMEGGKKVFYQIDDPLVFEALTSLAHPGMNSTAMKVMRAFKRTFTNLTTTTPQFMVANLIRDSLQASATNDVSKNAFKNVIDGGRTWKDERIRAQMMASGASFNFGHLYQNNPDELRAQLTRDMRNAQIVDGPYAIPGVLRKGWAWWNDVNNTAENLNRAAIYAQNRESGELRAAFESRDLIDFSAHGAWPAVRILIDIVPFLNARIQGLDKIYRSGFKPGANVLAEAFGKGQASTTDKQAAARFWTVAGALTMATVALYLHNQDDEEYQKLEDWQRDTYWFFRAGDNAFFIPKPFEVGAIATMAERITQQFLDDQATGKLFRQRMMHMMTDTFSFSPVPQMMQPALDIYANYDAFTGRPIESMGMERLSPELRRRASTSKAGEWISQGLNATVGAIGDPDKNPLALSPVQVDHLIGGYLGQVGTWVASIGDVGWRAATGQEAPARRWHEYQPVRRFYQNLGDEDRYTRYGTVFYEGLREAGRAYADVKELRELGRLAEAAEVADSRREMLALRLPLNRAQRRLNTINKRIDMIRRSEIGGELKRQRIDRLRAIKNQIQRSLGERVLEAKAG